MALVEAELDELQARATANPTAAKLAVSFDEPLSSAPFPELAVTEFETAWSPKPSTICKGSCDSRPSRARPWRQQQLGAQE